MKFNYWNGIFKVSFLGSVNAVYLILPSKPIPQLIALESASLFIYIIKTCLCLHQLLWRSYLHNEVDNEKANGYKLDAVKDAFERKTTYDNYQLQKGYSFLYLYCNFLSTEICKETIYGEKFS